MSNSHHWYIKNPVILASIAATVIFVLVGLIFNFGIHFTIFSTQVSRQSCQYNDPSLCELEMRVKNYMALGDVSDILEQQHTTRVVCDRAHASQAYCAGTSGLPVSLFRVDNTAGGSQLFSRNDYIAFFNRYFSAHGPFSYSSDSRDATHVIMKFVSKDNRAVYDLPFQKIASEWLLIAPKISQN